MLQTRVLTGIGLLLATLGVVFLLPVPFFHLVVAVLMLTGCREWARLGNLPTAAGWTLFALQTAILAAMHYYWPLVAAHAAWILVPACLAWLLMFSRLMNFRDDAPVDSRYRTTVFLSALVSITACWFALCWLRGLDQGAWVVLLMLIIIAASDVGAYFTGRSLGRTPLASKISPKKTREGLYGGLALAVIVAFIWAWPVAHLPLDAPTIIVATLLTAVVSVGGDLFISVHKRTVGLKDAGSIFPGHGGVLDRYDSVLAGAPFFALVIWLLQ